MLAKEILRANSELLGLFRRRLYCLNYCHCRTLVYLNSFTRQQSYPVFSLSCRLKSTKNTKNEKQKDISSLVQPVSVKPYIDPDGINIGEELTGTLKKGVAHFVIGSLYLPRITITYRDTPWRISIDKSKCDLIKVNRDYILESSLCDS